MLVAMGAASADLGNNNNWIFGGATLVWDGDDSTDWDDPDNWDLGFVPGPLDTAVIPSAPANQPILSTNVTITNLEIQPGVANVDLVGNNLTLTGTLTNDGTVNLYGSETISMLISMSILVHSTSLEMVMEHQQRTRFQILMQVLELIITTSRLMTPMPPWMISKLMER